jgi:D-alanyl-D-alanine carboxypeptidase/D-alanyl-D-alanine-endopeptidase (penicillin-binding protein 4)
MNIFNSKPSLLAAVLLILMTACSTTKKIEKNISEQNEKETFFRGLVVFDPALKKELVNYNGEKYFTPASNTKLFTFYAAYKTFKDSVAGLHYYLNADSLVIRGTADPSLLYGFEESKTLPFLRSVRQNIYVIDENIDEAVFGEGWAWDDYTYNYMVEKNLFPIYGNFVSINKTGQSVSSVPSFFTKQIEVNNQQQQRRNAADNTFFVKSGEDFKNREVPFRTSNQLVADLLSETLNKKVTLIPAGYKGDLKPFYSVAYDSLYKQMLVISDNFIAEQLMLQVGKELSGKYSVEGGIDQALKTYLADIPQKPRWTDGSGLSRYNLFTPESMVYLLKKMYSEIPREKLFSYFPVSGHSGTLKNSFKNEKPFIYAKTGTLSNNYNLSGYLITQKGKVLIFSYMNNHYLGSSNERKTEMEQIFLELYEKY